MKKHHVTFPVFLQTKAERALLELVRPVTEPRARGGFHAATANFTLEITVEAGHWRIKIDDHDTGRQVTGAGPSFGEAWVWPIDEAGDADDAEDKGEDADPEEPIGLA